MHGHIPVLLKEAIARIPCRDGGIYIDATFGSGGYTKEILKSIPNSFVFGIDQDPNLGSFVDDVTGLAPNRFKFINDNNVNLISIIDSYGINRIDGIIFDLGVSSMQLSAPERGFSFNLDGPLDMRMGSEGIPASQVINTCSEARLTEIMLCYGEEYKAKKIAKAIVFERSKKPINSTKHLADIVKSAINAERRMHPATKTFQALRIFVNNELKNLEASLLLAIESLSVGGVLLVVAFHSLEDRIVKRIFKHFVLQRPGTKEFRLLDKKPIVPSNEELVLNNRARSAKLRGLAREF
ncbi:MAG: 16S rRNA (cytosine(1402)-N(4))-methyltransferase RsmH [Holosporales bacterium]|jgi:16S rRNA (cytosine1402-N4)-methyltransferase|nr:16S rRNA (cytosine(1402)-N(4))-methyltransferase RsmH [Holosporales bacterium]